ncbi:MAG: hypothetical protein ACE5KM_18440, partial [Planctomycetaceae bacterium]
MDEAPADTPDPTRTDDAGPSPFRWWQVIAVALIVALCDIVIYRGKGYAGWAALFAGAPALMCLAATRAKRVDAMVPIAVMLLLLALRLFWFGSALPVGLGFALLA